MRLLGRDVPCGCDSRRDIMFTQGNLGKSEFIMLAGMVGVLLLAWKVKA